MCIDTTRLQYVRGACREEEYVSSVFWLQRRRTLNQSLDANAVLLLSAVTVHDVIFALRRVSNLSTAFQSDSLGLHLTSTAWKALIRLWRCRYATILYQILRRNSYGADMTCDETTRHYTISRCEMISKEFFESRLFSCTACKRKHSVWINSKGSK